MALGSNREHWLIRSRQVRLSPFPRTPFKSVLGDVAHTRFPVQRCFQGKVGKIVWAPSGNNNKGELAISTTRRTPRGLKGTHGGSYMTLWPATLPEKIGAFIRICSMFTSWLISRCCFLDCSWQLLVGDSFSRIPSLLKSPKKEIGTPICKKAFKKG